MDALNAIASLTDPVTQQLLVDPQITDCKHRFSLTTAMMFFGKIENQMCASPSLCPVAGCAKRVDRYEPDTMAQAMLNVLKANNIIQVQANKFNCTVSPDGLVFKFSNPCSDTLLCFDLIPTGCSLKFKSGSSAQAFLSEIVRSNIISNNVRHHFDSTYNFIELGFGEDKKAYHNFIKYLIYKNEFTRTARERIYAFDDQLTGEATQGIAAPTAVAVPVKPLPFKKPTFKISIETNTPSCRKLIFSNTALAIADPEAAKLPQIFITCQKGSDYHCEIYPPYAEEKNRNIFYDYLDAKQYKYYHNELKIDDPQEVTRILNIIKNAFSYAGDSREILEAFIVWASNPK